MAGFVSSRFPDQRWQIAPPQPEQANRLSQLFQLHPLLAQVLLNRGIDTPETARIFLDPELQLLPSPLDEFEDLPIALELLLRAISERQFVAICGDYDADGMTSTALLLRALRFLGAIVDYAIPSRMQEGYGINRRIVEEFHEEGVGLILTVDNGIAAHDPIARARELGMAIIVTDHHDIPPTLPPANAILNPKLIRETSPYRGVAGVGVAYILAVCLAQSLQKTQDLTTPLIELFTLGTIADLAPLTGVNRRWVKRGLKLLPKSRIAGVQALIQVAGLSNEKTLKPEAIGFRLGPRINAIGRISDPQIVIELLTTDEDGRALELAMKCEQVNQLRQRLCELIEQEAVAWCEETGFNPQQSRVLVIVQSDWHHGVIGIVASRLVERYGVPVFIGTYENETDNDTDNITTSDTNNTGEATVNPVANNTTANNTANQFGTDSSDAATPPLAMKIRGSARGIPEFNVFDALCFCDDVLEKFGGHKAAGGFTLAAENLDVFRSRLEAFAHQSLRPECLKPLVTVDVQANFRELTLDLYQQMDVLHPCGIENADPVFWTSNVHIVEQRTIGRDQAHLKLTLAQVDDASISLRAVAWRWGGYYPLPDRVDIAYRLRLNEWNGVQSVELELVGVRPTRPDDASMPSCQQAISSKAAAAISSVSQAQSSQTQLPRQSLQPRISQMQISQAEISQAEISQTKISQVQFSSVQLPQFKQQHSISTTSPPIHQNGHHRLEPTEKTLVESIEDQFACFDVKAFFNTSEHSMHQIEFYYDKRRYTGGVYDNGTVKELRIGNLEGQLLIIQPEQRRGFMGRAGAISEEIDVSQPYYFNLVRSALMALELAEKNQLIQEQVQQLAAQEQQIMQLQDQLILLQQQLSAAQQQCENQLRQNEEIQQRYQQAYQQKIQDRIQDTFDEQKEKLSTEPKQEISHDIQENIDTTEDLQSVFADLSAVSLTAIPEPKPSAAKPDDPKQRLKLDLGETVWNCLDSRSQKELVAAYKKLIAIQTEAEISATETAVDYSDVGLRLCSVIEREVVQPFFKTMHQFLLKNDEACEIGGVTLRARKKYTVGMVPPLLAAEWQSFQEEALVCSTPLTVDELYAAVTNSHVDPSDRDTIQVFLSQWEHPLAIWLQSPDATSAIAQIDRLLTIAADAENLLYEWQFELLQALILGNPDQPGILRQIYAI